MFSLGHNYAMASKIELLKHFKASGVKITHEDILNCSVDMCGRLFIDEKEFVESWVLYSKNNLNGAEPSVQLLLQMEREEFDEKTLGGSPSKKACEASLGNLELAMQDLNDNTPSSNPD